jgi:hypothetical protein
VKTRITARVARQDGTGVVSDYANLNLCSMASPRASDIAAQVEHLAETQSLSLHRETWLNALRGGSTDPPSGDQKLFRDRLFRNLPVLAVEDRNVKRLHRRVVVGRVAEIDVVNLPMTVENKLGGSWPGRVK